MNLMSILRAYVHNNYCKQLDPYNPEQSYLDGLVAGSPIKASIESSY